MRIYVIQVIGGRERTGAGLLRRRAADAIEECFLPTFELMRRKDGAWRKVRELLFPGYPGRVSERLLDPWLWVNGIEPAELPVVSPEPVDWIAKGKGFLAAKFLGKKYERSF